MTRLAPGWLRRSERTPLRGARSVIVARVLSRPIVDFAGAAGLLLLVLILVLAVQGAN